MIVSYETKAEPAELPLSQLFGFDLIVNSSRKFSTGLGVSKLDDERFDGAAFIPHFRIILSYQAIQSTSQGAGEKNDNISFD